MACHGRRETRLEKEPQLYRIEEAASQLGVGKTFLRNLIGMGEIKAVKLGRSTRIPSSEIRRFVAKLTAGAR